MTTTPRRRHWLAAAITVLAAVACGTPNDIATPVVDGPDAGTARYEDVVGEPPSLRGIKVGVDATGRPIRVDCMTCHSVRREHEVPATDDVRGLETVHADLTYRHGALSCRSCHDPERADRLRLADGRRIELADAMTLCAQCHGPQARDWDAGSHGGMRGYWDRRRGPATRNHCLDCHDPHDPRFPTYLPLPPTRDRFVTAGEGGGDEGHDG
jgi:nitrate reductase cytochrome c-type subunit